MTDAQICAGIDVAKDRLDVVLRPSGEYLKATNDEAGIRSVVRCLWQEGVALAVLEATGGMEQPAAAALVAAGVPVAIIKGSEYYSMLLANSPRAPHTSIRGILNSPSRR